MQASQTPILLTQTLTEAHSVEVFYTFFCTGVRLETLW